MSAEFVANMEDVLEDVLDLYAEPYDPQRQHPVVCFDETSTQLLAETRPALPPRPGLPLRQDYEYRREGTRNLFLACEPLAGWREVAVTERRTMQDFARRMRWLADEAYPEAEVVRVVLDNLNTHRRASLYETFPAEEARRIARRLEFHYTPKHGSWLNMAEIEFSVLSRCCLKQRLPDEGALRREVDALVTERNAAQATINWRFKTRANQVWAADITYLPMARGFLYLVAIMDWHSRYVVAWGLSNTLEAGFCAEALTEALGQGRPDVFNTDQGSQFTSREFTQILQGHSVKISMDGRGRYQDNILLERLWRTVKYEEVYLKAYANGLEARRELREYFRFYNHRRPHQALGYRTPAEVFHGEPVEKELKERRCPDQPVLVSYGGVQESHLIVA